MLPLVMRLKKKINSHNVALVTGAGSGIGKAVALGLAKKGLDVFLAGRKEQKLIITRQESLKKNYRGNCYIMKCNVANEVDVRKLFLLIKKKHGRLDLLFNNAGVATYSKTVDEIKYKDWKKIIDINVNGMFL